MTSPEILASIKDITLAIAGAVTASVAVVGLQNWNRELRGRAAFEVARSLARATYKLRDELGNCRMPVIWAHEFPEGYKNAGINRSAQHEAEGYAHVYSNRLAPVIAALQEFDTQTLEAEALWGADIRSITERLRKCVWELRAAIEANISNIQGGGEDFTSDREFGKMIRAAVSAGPNDSSNQLSTRISAAVGEMEDALRPHLRKS